MSRVLPRLTTLDLDALLRLSVNPDFAVYLTHLAAKQRATEQLYPAVVVSPEDIALYNKQRGFVEGLAIAASLCDMLLAYKEK